LEARLNFRDAICDLKFFYFKRVQEKSKESNANKVFNMICSHKNTNNEIIKFIEDNKIDVNFTSRYVRGERKSLLFAAVLAGSLALTRYLLNNGARVDWCDQEKRISLHVVVIKLGIQRNLVAYIAILCLLLEHGADMEAKDVHGKMPSDYLMQIQKDQPGKYKKIQKVIEKSKKIKEKKFTVPVLKEFFAV